VIARLRQPRSRAAYLLFGLIVTAVVLDLWQRAPRRSGGQMWFDNVVCASASPFQNAILIGLYGLEKQFLVIARGRRLAEENARLAAKVGELEAKLTQLEESYAEVGRARSLRASYPGAPRTTRIARVIAVGSGGWLSYLVVSSGSVHGTKVRDVALTADGVVGQVYAVTTQTARVLPITDPSSGVAVLVKDSREKGILKGTGGDLCELHYLAPDAQVKPGDQVLTTGAGGVFPKGIRVGTVVSVEQDRWTTGRVAMVAPAAEFRKIEEVLLVRASAAIR
jgi:rod shape-determining protein MreC